MRGCILSQSPSGLAFEEEHRGFMIPLPTTSVNAVVN